MIKKVLRKELIEKNLTEIVDSVNIVAENLPKEPEEFMTLGLIKEGMYKRIEFAIENILDICNIINSDLGLGLPEEEESILNNLEKNKVFKKEIIKKIREIKGFRNILIHKYGEINDEQAFDSIQDGLKDFEIIIKEIENFIGKKSC